MIEKAKAVDKAAILELWSQAYPTQEEAYLKFYFEHVFERGICLTKKLDKKVVASLQMQFHTIAFADKILEVGYILGASTQLAHRKQGYMKELLQAMLDVATHRCLISITRGMPPALAKNHDFEYLYERKAYTIKSDALSNVKVSNISNTASAKELCKAYQDFSNHFDGFYLRNEAYFKLLLNELKLKQKYLIVHRDKNQRVDGYLIYQEQNKNTIVQEAIYFESTILKKMLKKAVSTNETIILHVSLCEKIEKIFELSTTKKEPYMMARINNKSLFEKLYNCEYKSMQDLKKMTRNLLWIHEYY